MTIRITMGPGNGLSVNGKSIHMTNKEFSLFASIARRKGGTVSKDQLLSDLYGGLDEPEIKIVDVFVCKVRKKIGDDLKVIETTWGAGYRLAENVEIESFGVNNLVLDLDDETLKRFYDLAGISASHDAGSLATELFTTGLELAEKRAWGG